MNREGGFSVSGEDVIEEIDIFEGNENRLTFEEVFQTLTVQMKIVSGVHKDLQVHLPAADVPLWHPGIQRKILSIPQICSVLLKVRKLETAAMVLNPKTVDMESETMLTQYIIRKWWVVESGNLWT